MLLLVAAITAAVLASKLLAFGFRCIRGGERPFLWRLPLSLVDLTTEPDPDYDVNEALATYMKDTLGSHLAHRA